MLKESIRRQLQTGRTTSRRSLVPYITCRLSIREAPRHHRRLTHCLGPVLRSQGSTNPGIYVDPSGVATIYCTYDCRIFTGEPIYVANNSPPTLNGVYTAYPNGITSTVCTPSPHQLTFMAPATVVRSTTYLGGIVWSADYWPVVMPFAVQHSVSSLEVYECDMDYAFGHFSPPATLPDHPTTAWVATSAAGSGCTEGAVVPSDVGYPTSAGDTQVGQPQGTSVRAGQSVLVQRTQF